MIAISTIKAYNYTPIPFLTPSERDEYNKVREGYKKLQEENERLKDENTELKDRIKELEKNLKKSQHKSTAQSISTPSSKQFPKSNRPPKGSRPRGAPKGHQGTSLKIPKQVDRTVIHSPDKCPFCDSSNLGKETDGWTQTVLDIEPRPFIVTAHVFKRRWCPQCQKKVSMKSTETLPHRNYGPNLAVFVGLLVEMGIPLPKIQLLLKILYHHTISEPELMALSNLVGDALKQEYQRLLHELKHAPAVNADETCFRVNGINHWCWVFVWDEGIIYVIHPSRGSACPKEALGEDFKGVLGRDGWRAYNIIDCEQQLDYVHVNRDFQKVELERGLKDRGFITPEAVKFTKNGKPTEKLKEFIRFVDEMRSIMRDAVKFTERNPPPDSEERFWMLEQLLARFDAVLSADWEDKDVVRLRAFLQTHRAHFFTFVIFPEIHWDNNRAERGVRNVSPIRNNSGGRRSQRGADTLQTTMSVFLTWIKRGMNVFYEARTSLLNWATQGSRIGSVA